MIQESFISVARAIQQFQSPLTISAHLYLRWVPEPGANHWSRLPHDSFLPHKSAPRTSAGKQALNPRTTFFECSSRSPLPPDHNSVQFNMEPISAAASVLGVLGAIASVSSAATRFMLDIQSARKEIIAVKKELSALKGGLEILADDLNDSTESSYHDGVVERIADVANNCRKVFTEIGDCVQSYEGSRLRWAASGKENMERLRRELEIHKSTLSVTLDLVSVIALRDIKNDTGSIIQDTSAILQDTGQIQSDIDRILGEISRLQSQLSVPVLGGGDRQSNYVLERFLGDLRSDAETVLGETDYREELDLSDRPAAVQRSQATREREGQPIPSSPQLQPSLKQGSEAKPRSNVFRMIQRLFTSTGDSARYRPDRERRETSSQDNTVILTDTRGNRYTFPYEACKEWRDMNQLILQCYGNLDAPNWVRFNDYNLIGPSGIILPSVWESLVKPGLKVRMEK
ncbi:hypothetical protein V8F33_006050 [Rhypophila sp. PSN 637]